MDHSIFYSSTEYDFPDGLLGKFLQCLEDLNHPLFLKSRFNGLECNEKCRVLLRRESSSFSSKFKTLTKKPIDWKSSDAIFKLLSEINTSIGDAFNIRTGFRVSPVLVYTKDHPWASFVVPNFNARAVFSRKIKELSDVYSSCGNKYFLVLGMCLLVVLVHPFCDGNGRTMRIVLFKALRDLLHCEESAALYYANFAMCTKNGFVSSFYEIRESENFSPFLKMFF